jgi:hypothetical protein
MGEELTWLYRQHDLVLGPVPTSQIVDKLYSGELTPASEVQLLGGAAFSRIAEVPEFRIPVAKSEARRRVEAQAAEHQAQARRRLVRTVALVAVALVLVGAGLAMLGRYLAVHTPTGKSPEELAWGEITIDPPTVSRARSRVGDDLVEYRSGAPKPGSTSAPPPRVETVARPPLAVAQKPKLGRDDAEGLQAGEVDEAGINSVVATHKPSLIPCIKQVAKAGIPARIPIEFAISDAGKVTRVWVDNPDFKDPALAECLLRELQKWPFKAGPSGASVNLSFNVGKPG